MSSFCFILFLSLFVFFLFFNAAVLNCGEQKWQRGFFPRRTCFLMHSRRINQPSGGQKGKETKQSSKQLMRKKFSSFSPNEQLKK